MDEIDALRSQVGIIIDGKSCALGASAGQYVILKNSEISGKSDGLYTAASPISAGETNVTAAMLSNPITNGGLNSLKNSLTQEWEVVTDTGFPSVNYGSFSVWINQKAHLAMFRFAGNATSLPNTDVTLTTSAPSKIRPVVQTLINGQNGNSVEMLSNGSFVLHAKGQSWQWIQGVYVTY